MPSPIYAVGDIHGQLDRLNHALDLIETDGGTDAPIMFLGDLVDRGAESRGVIDRLMQRQAVGKPWRVLKGNHDRMFARFMREGTQHDPGILSGLGWLHPRLGGVTTLVSYGVTVTEGMPMAEVLRAARAAVPEAHIDFLERLPLYHEQGDLLFVHAGILPGVPLDAQVEDDLIWIRDPFLQSPVAHPWLVVHGHTALEHPQHFGNRIDLDGGAGYGNPIHPAKFQGRDCWLLKDEGRVKLEP